MPKTSLKLPIFLIIGPALGFMLAIILYAVVNAMSAGSGATQSDTELFSEPSGPQVMLNVVLFLLGSLSTVAFVPCLIIGIVLLNRRRHQAGE